MTDSKLRRRFHTASTQLGNSEGPLIGKCLALVFFHQLDPVSFDLSVVRPYQPKTAILERISIPPRGERRICRPTAFLSTA